MGKSFQDAEISVRSAGLGDLPALCGLLHALFSIEADFRPDPERQRRGLELLLGRDEACVLVAESAGQVVGMCTAQLLISTAEGGRVALVEDVVVDAGCRGAGLGTRLLTALEDWCRERGATRLQLLADSHNTAALAFYRRTGWQETQLVARRKSV